MTVSMKRRIGAIVILLAMICALNIFYLNPYEVKIRDVYYHNAKIDRKLDGFQLLVISDLHYGTTIKKPQLTKIIKKINLLHPDAVIFLGDLLAEKTGEERETSEFIRQMFAQVQAPAGKYALLGDLDQKDNQRLKNVRNIWHLAGFEVLNNQALTLTYHDSAFELVALAYQAKEEEIKEAFRECDHEQLVIALSHYPDNFLKSEAYQPDIFLAGHSLGGEVYLPLITEHYYLKDGARTYFRKQKQIGPSLLDINNGLGNTTKSIRFLADAEIVIYHLTAA